MVLGAWRQVQAPFIILVVCLLFGRGFSEAGDPIPYPPFSVATAESIVIATQKEMNVLTKAEYTSLPIGKKQREWVWVLTFTHLYNNDESVTYAIKRDKTVRVIGDTQ